MRLKWWRTRTLRHDAPTMREACGMDAEEAKAVLLRVALAFGDSSVSKSLATLFPDLSPRELYMIATYARVYHEFEEFKTRFTPPIGGQHKGVDYVG